MISEEKRELRKIIRKKRAEFKIENKDIDKRIFENVKKDALFLSAKSVFCYISYGFEVETGEILKEILRMGKTLAVPKCLDANGIMIAVEIKEISELKVGMYGIMEPAGEIPYKKENIDLAIVPGLAFSKDGYRLGYGKGYYDRFLKDSKIKTIGICPHEFLLKDIPHDNNDIPVNKVITEID